MTVLAPVAPTRSISWSAFRLIAGALLFMLGASILLYARNHHTGYPVAMGAILALLGIATAVQKSSESVMLPVSAVVFALIPFSLFIGFAGANPFKVLATMYEGAFGSWFSFQNTLTRAAPLLLTGLCTALPLRVGLVIIGGEGAFIMGALFAAASAHVFQLWGCPNWLVLVGMLTTGALVGGLWITIAGALKHYRGVNETISSLLLIYLGIAIMNHLVEGPWRYAESLNKPSTWPVGDDNILGLIHFGSFEMDVHWGLVIGIGVCLLCWILMNKTTFGFSAQIVGGNLRAARIAGLSLGKIILVTCMLAGAAAGLAGGIEIAAVQLSCNNAIRANYGYAGILVAFLARGNPIAIIPVAILLGGIGASGDLLQQNLNLPDATVNVLQGIIFLVILAAETYYGKFQIFQRKEHALG